MMSVKTGPNLRQAAENLYCALTLGHRRCGIDCKSRLRVSSRSELSGALIKHSLSGRAVSGYECFESGRATKTSNVLRYEGEVSGNGVPLFSWLSCLWKGSPCLDELIPVYVRMNAGISTRGRFTC